jgi:predicted amidohydrolase
VTGGAIEVAAIELPQRFGDPAGALAEVGAVLGSEAARGVELALLPEAILTGYVSPRGDFDLRPFAEPLEGPTAGALADLARRHGLAVAGPLIEEDGGRFYNTLLLFDREGALAGRWRKRHPWFPERWASPGDLGTPVVELLGLRVAAAICFDVHFLSEDAGAALDRADVLLFPTAWVDEAGGGDLRAELLPPLARRHRVAVVNANWAPSRPLFPGQGRSRVLDARGRVVAEAPRGRGARVVRATLGPVKPARRG